MADSDKMKSLIKMMKKDEGMRRDIVLWILKNEHEKEFKKCKTNLADDCEGIGLASEYHGRRCKACTKEYNRTYYSKGHPEVKRTRKDGTKPQKD